MHFRPCEQVGVIATWKEGGPQRRAGMVEVVLCAGEFDDLHRDAVV